MQLIFERGNREAPIGHALLYFRGDDGSILATYVSVPPIPFNIADFVPNIFAGMLQGIDADALNKVTTPMPPIPQPVSGVEWLRNLAERRADDIVFAGGAMRSDPMRLAAEAAEAAQEYGELYERGHGTPEVFQEAPLTASPTMSRFADLSEGELLREMNTAIGRLRGSLASGEIDVQAREDIDALAALLPSKYRARELAGAAIVPGDRGRRLAELYLERSYKLLNEDYLDLTRIDREIEALSE
jgi:hypothetical protein